MPCGHNEYETLNYGFWSLDSGSLQKCDGQESYLPKPLTYVIINATRKGIETSGFRDSELWLEDGL